MLSGEKKKLQYFLALQEKNANAFTLTQFVNAELDGVPPYSFNAFAKQQRELLFH